MNDELHKLIKSLSKSEKAYFKRNVLQLEGDTFYLKLFDIMNEMSVYDEEKAKIVIVKYGFNQQFTYLKNYLFEKLLKSIDEYSSFDTIKYRLESMIKQIMVLEMKDVLNVCISHIKRAKKIAVAYEFFNEIILLNKIEYKIHLKLFDKTNEICSQLNEENNSYILQSYNYLLYDALYRQIHLALLHAKETQIKQLLKDDLLKHESLALSQRAKGYFYTIKSIENSIIGNYEKQYYYADKILSNFESLYKEEVFETPHEYITRINNYLIAASNFKRHEKYQKYLQILKEISKKKIKPQYKLQALQYYYLNNFSFLYSSGQLEESKKLILEIEKEGLLHQIGLKNYFRENLYSYCFKTYFALNDYKSALKYLNEISNNKKLSIEYWKLLSKILNIIIHYELGNISNIESELTSLERYIKLSNKSVELEKMLINYFKQLLKTYDKNTIILLNKALYENIINLKKKGSEKLKLELFDFENWLQCKIQGKNIHQILTNS